MPVAVVTDSTAYLPAALIEKYDIEVVPLYVVLAGRSGREGSEISPDDVARALSARGKSVSTSRPTPGDFVAAYRRRLGADADRLVSIHLSSELSSTTDAARLAASQVGEHRTSSGPFGSVEELDDVPGIGPSIAAELAGLVTV